MHRRKGRGQSWGHDAWTESRREEKHLRMTMENEELCGGELDLPGAGELIMGPTVLGEVMAAGNLIWASPPYLVKEQSV